VVRAFAFGNGRESDSRTEPLKAVPRTGPVLVVANHPFGLLDGAAPGVLLSQVRSDVR
jgi:putative hemolysin